jgi:uncharacterized membrane protein
MKIVKNVFWTVIMEIQRLLRFFMNILTPRRFYSRTKVMEFPKIYTLYTLYIKFASFFLIFHELFFKNIVLHIFCRK